MFTLVININYFIWHNMCNTCTCRGSELGEIRCAWNTSFRQSWSSETWAWLSVTVCQTRGQTLALNL